MAFVTTFSPKGLTASSSFTSGERLPQRAVAGRAAVAPRTAPAAMLKDYTKTGPVVDYDSALVAADEYMASSVHRQYIAKACPSGEPPLQCIEGSANEDVYALRTLKRQSQLRFRQQPIAARLRAMYEMRREGVAAAHGCSHEEGHAMRFPTMAAAYVVGQAEASKACSRYFDTPKGSAEDAMQRSVENAYQKAVNGSGTFSTVCTDGQARYEAYLAQVRGKSTMYRAKQYSTFERESMKFAARKQAISVRAHNCSYEEDLFNRFPAASASMRPSIGYYPPFVTAPKQGYTIGVAQPGLSPITPSGIYYDAKNRTGKAADPSEYEGSTFGFLPPSIPAAMPNF